MEGKPRTLRKLGKLERFSSVRHALGYYNNVGVTATYVLKTRPTSLEASIYAAFKGAIDAHPALSAITVDELTDAYFVQAPSIDLSKVIRFVERRRAPESCASEDQELDEILQSEHNTRFLPSEGEEHPPALWRAVVSSHPSSPTHVTISFIYHHSIGDGLSGLVIQRSLASSLTDPATLAISTPQPLAPSPPTHALSPPMESLLPLPLSLPFLLRALWSDWFPSRPKGIWTGMPATTPLAVRFRSFSFTPHETKSFAAACKTQQTSLTAGFQVVIAAALFEALPGEWETLGCTVPVSLRRFVRGEEKARAEETMGVVVASVNTAYTRSGTKSEDRAAFWAEARRSRDEVTKLVKKDGRDTNSGLLRYVSDVHEFFAGKVGKERGDSFEVSSLGVVRGEGMGRAVFSQSATVTGPAVEVGIMTGGDGCLSVGVTWQEGVVDEEVVRKVVEISRELIRDLGTEKI
ncbi:hypothetical protein P152DRAFT_439569 [Eremomyces bilateralis CBS 781.70]|uniref:Alcohol acetyltransferase n=1 Tax=Eremomyces bilateralis CBS 781.70 TaxID=1392243 RepID=A0A6G1FXQ6_9PEZI|nr:uncharacterized protein P152DRAFT_439569 [Eremomyces bilateralis CBS 781.70]KAF1810617.1 hypothetical protein P152DRAFT_439569 [Eremomyces bilateralis CBS 781.70]